MKGVTALVIGATGLVGSHLVQELLQDDRYHKVITFSRRPLEFNHPKLEAVIANFEKLDEIADKIQGDILFSCLGTTRKQAGSKENFYKVDFTYQYRFIQLAAQNGIRQLVLISSPGASINAFYSHYLKTKGQLDEAVKGLKFDRIVYIKPSLLAGERSQNRTGEKVGILLGNTIGKYIPGLKKYRPIEGRTVAKAMAQLPFEQTLDPVSHIELEQLFKYASH